MVFGQTRIISRTSSRNCYHSKYSKVSGPSSLLESWSLLCELGRKLNTGSSGDVGPQTQGCKALASELRLPTRWQEICPVEGLQKWEVSSDGVNSQSVTATNLTVFGKLWQSCQLYAYSRRSLGDEEAAKVPACPPIRRYMTAQGCQPLTDKDPEAFRFHYRRGRTKRVRSMRLESYGSDLSPI